MCTDIVRALLPCKHCPYHFALTTDNEPGFPGTVSLMNSAILRDCLEGITASCYNWIANVHPHPSSSTSILVPTPPLSSTESTLSRYCHYCCTLQWCSLLLSASNHACRWSPVLKVLCSSFIQVMSPRCSALSAVDGLNNSCPSTKVHPWGPAQP